MVDVSWPLGVAPACAAAGAPRPLLRPSSALVGGCCAQLGPEADTLTRCTWGPSSSGGACSGKQLGGAGRGVVGHEGCAWGSGTPRCCCQRLCRARPRLHARQRLHCAPGRAAARRPPPRAAACWPCPLRRRALRRGATAGGTRTAACAPAARPPAAATRGTPRSAARAARPAPPGRGAARWARAAWRRTRRGVRCRLRGGGRWKEACTGAAS